MSEKQKRKRFTKEEIAHATSLVIEQGISITDVSNMLGYSQPNISRWVKQERERASYKSAGLNYDSIIQENKRLKRQLKDAEIERDILKKAAAIFSKDHR